MIFFNMVQIGKVTNINPIKANLGGGNVVTLLITADSNLDTYLVVGDTVIVSSLKNSNKYVLLGLLKAEASESVKLYSRTLSGSVACNVNLKADGSIKIENDLGSIALASNGTITINNVTIDPNGNIETSGTVTSKQVTLNTHIHPGDGEPPVTGT